MSRARDIEPAAGVEEREPNRAPGRAGRCAIAVIGIDRYRHWPQLSNAVSDATGAARLFERLGFELIAEPLLDERATGRAIQALVTDELRTLGPEDSLVLFYAGHGGTRKHRVGGREVKTGYLVPVDAAGEPDRVSTWVELDGWLRAISLLPARHILVVLDACHSGIALDPILKWRDLRSWQDTPLSALTARLSRRIITSALDDQRALDSGPLFGHSLFMGCLIEALTGGIPRSASGMTTGSELGLYVQRRVQAYPESRQTPDFGTFGLDDRGEMAIPLAVGATDDDGDGPPPRSQPGPGELPRGSQRRSIALAAAGGALASAAIAYALLEHRRGPDPRPVLSDATPAPPDARPTTPTDAPGPPDASSGPPVPEVIANRWVRIDPPAAPYRLGVADAAPEEQVGFRASAGIVTPSRPYELQEHEVTWSELEPWLARTGARGVAYPPWATDARTRAALPATAIAWQMASQYCRALGGALPTEEEWEYAARGPGRRPSPWGAGPVDLRLTHTFAGPGAVPAPVMTSRQDRTPQPGGPIWDLAGNVQEWTLGLWREDRAGKEPDAQHGRSWAGAIRGFPLAEPPPAVIPPDAAAYRKRLCAEGACVEKTREILAYVGFRCARSPGR